MSSSSSNSGPRTAIVSTSVPPAATGQATVLKRLFENRSPENCLFLTDDLGTDHLRAGDLPFAAYRSLDVPKFIETATTATLAENWRATLIHLKAVFLRADQIIKHLNVFKPDVVIACSGSRVDLPATWLACTRLGLPFITYLFDDPVYQWGGGRLSRIASCFEAFWSISVSAVIAPNDLLFNDFKSRRPLSRCKSVIIRNPTEPDAIRRVYGDVEAPVSTSPKNILYSGSIYSAQADALKNLVDAVDLADGLYELHVYSPQPEAVIEGLNLQSKYLKFHGYVSGKEIYKHQQTADILFLPLAFKSNIQQCLRTAAPGKTGEYLASGRPVLVHAPDYTFIAQYFKAKECGMVVDEPDPLQLLDALQRLSNDPVYCAEIIKSAEICADEFSSDTGRQKMDQIIQAVVPGRNQTVLFENVDPSTESN